MMDVSSQPDNSRLHVAHRPEQRGERRSHSDRSSELHSAAMQGKVDEVKRLIEGGMKAESPNNLKSTALHYARNAEIAKLLLDHKASVATKNHNGGTPLHMAAHSRRLDVLSVLLNYKADPAEMDNQGYTCLHGPAGYGYAEVVELLIDQKADPSRRGIDGNTPLHLATRSGSVKTVKMLLDKKADVGTPNNAGETSLRLAKEYKPKMGSRRNQRRMDLPEETRNSLAMQEGEEVSEDKKRADITAMLESAVDALVVAVK